jgi:hypothetical protein
VLTPHPLEAARLLGITTAEIQQDRRGAALKLAVMTGSIVVLKGAGSVVAGPDGGWSINRSGGPILSVAGTGDVLEEGHTLIHKVAGGKDDIRVTDRSLIWNTDLLETLEFDNLISQAVVTMDSALNRQESRGAHAREDFSARDDVNWMKHTLAWLDEKSAKVKIDYRPVHTYTMSNDIQYIEPKARVY